MRDFQKLAVWHRANAFKVALHRVAPDFRGAGAAETRNQILRSASAIATNVAQGCGKRTDAELARYLDIALGSATETESHLLFARDVGWLAPRTFHELEDELIQIRRMLYAFWKAVKARTLHG